jgi:WhiB family redox-sensing transcriptional regulator
LYEDDASAVEGWRYKAKCRGMDTELWYPPRDKTQYKDIAAISKAVCYGKDGLPACPVRKECLLYSDKMDEQHGIWGGMSHRERSAFKRKATRAGISFSEWINMKNL